MKKYRVNIDMIYSEDIVVSAKNTREAKMKAFDQFQRTKIKRKKFRLYTDEIQP